MILLPQTAVAELLFTAALFPVSVTEAGRMAGAEYRRRRGDLAAVAAEMAAEFGDHPQAAVARMRRCLAIAPLRLELPDSYGPDWLRGELPDSYGSPWTDWLCDALLAETAGPDDENQEVTRRG